MIRNGMDGRENWPVAGVSRLRLGEFVRKLGQDGCEVVTVVLLLSKRLMHLGRIRLHIH